MTLMPGVILCPTCRLYLVHEEDEVRRCPTCGFTKKKEPNNGKDI